MKEQFKDIGFKADSLARIEFCNEVITDYLGQGLRLTLRQLYYQLVSRNIVPNTERSYQNLSTLVSNARLAGMMDWSAIEDRVRQPRRQSEFNNLRELVDVAVRSYRLPRWADQDHYAELWVEKDALAGVLAPLASKFHVTMMVNRGYSSQSAMYESAQRFIENGGTDKQLVLFYLGDHDPSGEDMVRDIEDRLLMFNVDNLRVEKLALTMSQIRKYNPPPNPAKMSDSRAAKYVELHGDESWEVDALPPEVLTRIITTAFEGIVDEDKMEVWKAREQRDKDELTRMAAKVK